MFATLSSLGADKAPASRSRTLLGASLARTYTFQGISKNIEFHCFFLIAFGSQAAPKSNKSRPKIFLVPSCGVSGDDVVLQSRMRPSWLRFCGSWPPFLKVLASIWGFLDQCWQVLGETLELLNMLCHAFGCFCSPRPLSRFWHRF